jgi:hypothetical protein
MFFWMKAKSAGLPSTRFYARDEKEAAKIAAQNGSEIDADHVPEVSAPKTTAGIPAADIYASRAADVQKAKNAPVESVVAGESEFERRARQSDVHRGE